MLTQGVNDGLETLIPKQPPWSRDGHEEEEEEGGVGGGKVGCWGPLMGGEFILEAQIQKGVLNP